ncbi:MAG: T9SS type A sorting domain-containing protein [Crocinitomix sp.]|nr:T9SS type A sorting domain-containing protein [Crocinitomix sp.]
MIKYLTITLLVISSASQAQTVLLEEDFTSGIPSTWALFNEDGLTPEAEVADFTAAWIAKISGVDTAAASTSYYDDTLSLANDYLITPQVSLGNFSRVIWSARSVDVSYPDGYQVLISTTDSLPASFTDTLMTVVAETGYMNTRGIELDAAGYANQDVFIAFRNNTTDGYILLIDDVKVLGAETATICTIKPNIALTIYPNPTAEFLNINTDEAIISVSIYTTAGQLLISDQTSRIDVSSLNAGLYYIQIETVNGLETSQFVKQ